MRRQLNKANLTLAFLAGLLMPLAFNASDAHASELLGCRYTVQVEDLGDSPLLGELAVVVVTAEPVGQTNAELSVCEAIGLRLDIVLDNPGDLLVNGVEVGDAAVFDYFRTVTDSEDAAHDWWWYDQWTQPTVGTLNEAAVSHQVDENADPDTVAANIDL